MQIHDLSAQVELLLILQTLSAKLIVGMAFNIVQRNVMMETILQEMDVMQLVIQKLTMLVVEVQVPQLLPVLSVHLELLQMLLNQAVQLLVEMDVSILLKHVRMEILQIQTDAVHFE